MKRRFGEILVTVAVTIFVPAAAFAQASIAGVVKDTSGAVLPGVTVEAASPALIEKVRSVVTDGNGQYRIVDLRPGSYSVTFTLPGFNTVKREGVELSGSFAATVDAEMRIGALEETITVSGQAPTVDTQNTTQQRVMNSDVINAIPTGRNEYNLAQLIPGVQTTGGLANQDVGGALGHETFEMTVHGSKGDSQRVTMNGVSIGTIVGGGTRAGSVPNPQSFQEVAIDTAAVSAELPTGGVRVNFIPREGGNDFKGSVFAAFANEDMQGSNFSDRVRARGLGTPNLIKKNWDLNPGFGGPIQRDKLWFYTSVRYNGAANYAAGMFDNLNANDPTKWRYEPDLNRPASNDGWWKDAQGRMTWQVNPKNKLSFSYDQQVRLTSPNSVSATLAPEASNDRDFPMQRLVQLDYSAPLTTKILFDAAAVHRVERWGFMHPHEKFVLNPEMISVFDQGLNLSYRAGRGGTNGTRYNNTWVPNANYRASISYITGTHAVKVGMNDGFGSLTQRTYDFQPYHYVFNNGVPTQVRLFATPYEMKVKLDHDLGLYAQDKWTLGRLVLSYGVRYDYYASSNGETNLGPAPLTPTRNIQIPESDTQVAYHDVTPKFGAIYDVFGDGKTALKVTYNKYLEGLGAGGIATSVNPVSRMVVSAARSWTDANSNFTPDCDLLNTTANGECGAMNQNFGLNNPNNTTFDPDVLKGWGKRGYNWEFSAGVQHELMPRVSADVAYFRRWYGNFLVTDNTALTAADFDRFSITVPNDPRASQFGYALPNVGQAITGFYNVTPSKFGLLGTSERITFAKNFGDMSEKWHGVDLNLTARLENGLLAAGGFSTGKSMLNFCDVLAQVPEMTFSYASNTYSGLTNAPYCDIDQKFTTQVKGYVAYTMPRVDVQVSATFQSLPGQEMQANYNAPSAVVAQSLGRPLAGNAANVTLNLVEPGSAFSERVNQLDLRFGKVLRFGPRRASINLDVYNALNADAILQQNQTFGAAWQRPNLLLPARFLKVSASFDF